MINKKNSRKRRLEKTLSLFEISILIISIVAFSYFIGDEFKLVGATQLGIIGSLPSGTAGMPYLANNLVATGGNPPYSVWSLAVYINNNLVSNSGLKIEEIDSFNAKITGTPTVAGTYSITVTVSDTATTKGGIPNSGLETFTIVIAPGAIQNPTGSKTAQTQTTAPSPASVEVKDKGVTVQDVTSTATAAAAVLPIFTPKSTEQAAATGTFGNNAPTGVTTEAESMSWDKFANNIKTNTQSLITNGLIAAGIWGAFYLISLIPGTNAKLLNSLGQALGIGYGIGSGLGVVIQSLGGNGLTMFGVVGAGWGLIGAGVGLIFFLINYREERMDAVNFNCYPWQPATGGGPNKKDDCQQCNKGTLPCTKYKCQSLGQNCELANEGTSEEVCVWNNRNDVNPPTIKPLDDVLTEGYVYEPLAKNVLFPGDLGVQIKNKASSDGCIPPFTKVNYGIALDKPGQCRIDTNRTDTYDEMTNPGLIDQGYYMYNHTLLSFHPGTVEAGTEGIQIQNGGNYETYVRCESKNGVADTATFVFKYCVQNEPDTTAPTIVITDPLNGMPIAKGQSSIDINVYTDKPADCKWSHSDEDYDTMAGTMTCAQSITEINTNLLYKCSATLDGLKDETENNFYFRCKSYPKNSESDRYKNTESYPYTLYGTQDLAIDSISPVSGTTIKDSTASVKVTFTAKTSAGYDNGNAICSIKETSQPDTGYSKFKSDATAVSYQHTQDLWLDAGSYDYSIKCCDLGGNCQTETTKFDVETDTIAPVVTRMYNNANQLNIITNELADCVYDTTDCSYNFDDGLKMTTADNLEHSTIWKTSSVFYIKCKDEFGNKPNANECSIIARPITAI